MLRVINGIIQAAGGVLGRVCCNLIGGTCCGDACYCGEGECCGDVWRTDEGQCCGGVWITPDNEGQCCGEEWIPAGTEGACCPITLTGLDEIVYIWVEGEDVTCEGIEPFCLDCRTCPRYPPPCNEPCCADDGSCSMVTPGQCPPERVYPGNCIENPCPVSCCSEDADGNVQCDRVHPSQCLDPAVVDPQPCESACLGACCTPPTDEEPAEYLGQYTQSQCESLGGEYQGIGSTECSGPCRSPFTEDCCESKKSTGLGLTFFQPRKKRSPQFTQALRVRVTGTTKSPIRVHGTYVPAWNPPYEACPFNVEFLLCWDAFNIEPMPCGSSFADLDVTVCWLSEENTEYELSGLGIGATASPYVEFSGCNNITNWLGDCDKGCTTKLRYSENGNTSNTRIEVRGQPVIEANGTGPLILTGPIVFLESCDVTLHLTGSSTYDNRISAVIGNPPGHTTSVLKTGSGRWLLAATNTYTGSSTVLSGELVLAANASGPGAGALGNGGALTVGEPGGWLPAALLLKDGIQIDSKTITIPTGCAQPVYLGIVEAGSAIFANDGSQTVRVGSTVTLVAPAGGTATFLCNWVSVGGKRTIIVGADGKTGTVVFRLNGISDAFLSLRVYAGTALLDEPDLVHEDVILVVSEGTLDIGGFSQAFSDIQFDAIGGSITNGTLRIPSGGGSVETALSGNTISAGVELDGEATFKGQGSLLVSGVVSGGVGIVKEGGGTLRLSAVNTYTGGTIIDGGEAKAENAAAFGTGEIVVNAGGTLNKNGFTLPNTITNNGGTVID